MRVQKIDMKSRLMSTNVIPIDQNTA